MKTLSLIVVSAVSLMLVGVHQVAAKDKVRVVSESKVAAAKGLLREKAASEWMDVKQIEKLSNENQVKGKQLIYFEYHIGKDQWRAIYTDKVILLGYSWWVFYGKNEMEEKVNSEIENGLTPAFIARSGAAYAMLFVKPEQLAEARKVLEELGVSEPKLR